MSGFNSSGPCAAADAAATLNTALGVTESPVSQATCVPVASVRRTRRGRFKMALVLAACASPVLASYFAYYVIKPEGRRNFGELISPQWPVPPLAAQALDGQTSSLSDLKGQWLLLSVDSGRCEAACEQKLYLQRQLRESLGREKDRLDRVWLIADEVPVRAELQAALGASQVLRVPQAQLQQWLQAAPGHALSDHLYVVDPQGNWMMRFPANLDVASANRVKKDLDRLMRGSAFWDQPGRGTQEGH